MNINEKGLVLNISYNEFLLGSNVSLYTKRQHHVEMYFEPEDWFCYYFYTHGKEIELWCINGIIESICCRISCIYDGYELIGMNFEDFLHIIKEKPSEHNINYVPINEHRGQNQHVYDFERCGLQIWTWRKKIKTVIISNSND